ncbi:MAG TPA: DUF6655 family protein [Pirellulales bacterium]
MYRNPANAVSSVGLAGGLLLAICGCATVKQSDTARTGVEQLLISSAVDRALDQVDLSPLRGSKVFVDPQYLDCVDKSYVFISLNQRLLATGATLAAKAEESDVVLQVGSGGVGTDRHDLFVGITEIPLPPPSPIAIPQFSLFDRSRANGTAKLCVIAFNAKTRAPIINSGVLLARSDYKMWKLLGAGSYETGSIQQDLATADRVSDSKAIASRSAAPSPPAFSR